MGPEKEVPQKTCAGSIIKADVALCYFFSCISGESLSISSGLGQLGLAGAGPPDLASLSHLAVGLAVMEICPRRRKVPTNIR